jgi:tRNA A-37 threonylcarbamoyl transferase component Bud32
MTPHGQDQAPNLILGRYQVLHPLGHGGMGEVLLARVEGDLGFSRPVVLKVMRAEMAMSDEGMRLFQREAQILSRLQHPAIPNILDFGVENGALIMVLEYVHGYSVADWLNYRYATKETISVDVCLAIARRILDALAYAHHLDNGDATETEIVHRDVSPDNIVLDRKGYAYLLDFGIASVNGHTRARSTDSGVFRGKLGYAAPELLLGEMPTPKCDQYSLAVTLLEMLSLELPFRAGSPAETLRLMAVEMPKPPSAYRSDVPRGLDEIILRALAKNPDERFSSVREFARALARFQRKHDEEVAIELRAVIEKDFDELPAVVRVEPLAAREAVMELGAIGRPPSLMPGPLRGEQTKKWGPWAVLGGVILSATLVVAVVLLARLREPSQVVVVGGPREAAPPAAALGPAHVAEGKSPELEVSLGDALARGGSAIEGCFVQHVELAEKMPEATLRFSLEAGASRAHVSLQPDGLAKSALGACLKEVGETIVLPSQPKAMSFRVPVRAKFANVP